MTEPAVTDHQHGVAAAWRAGSVSAHAAHRETLRPTDLTSTGCAGHWPARPGEAEVPGHRDRPERRPAFGERGRVPSGHEQESDANSRSGYAWLWPRLPPPPHGGRRDRAG